MHSTQCTERATCLQALPEALACVLGWKASQTPKHYPHRVESEHHYVATLRQSPHAHLNKPGAEVFGCPGNQEA
eukprot:m.81569 g.81569  ORF g.81569 m.81569 type:complete len:74 (+) comp14574_c1_seq7:1370-1591(+)